MFLAKTYFRQYMEIYSEENNTIKRSYINATFVRIRSEKESNINATNIEEIKIVITVSLSFLMVRTFELTCHCR